jgi:hypothetical protein
MNTDVFSHQKRFTAKGFLKTTKRKTQQRHLKKKNYRKHREVPGFRQSQWRRTCK